MAAQVLLADDDENFALLFRVALQAVEVHGLEVVEDGLGVIRYLSAEDTDHPAHPFPELLLLDVHLPRLNGLEVLRWLRNKEDWNCLRVMMLTGVEVESEARLAEALGANGYLVKPFGFDALVRLAQGLRAEMLEPQHGFVHAAAA